MGIAFQERIIENSNIITRATHCLFMIELTSINSILIMDTLLRVVHCIWQD